ncbi:MAG: Pirin domain protein [Burkholderiales bacterium]|jgi:redox-sensitive bicupin YhaK (pirin superfamily)|nr:Pirin domain protein [Burkholderiales bacterium]
MIKIRRASERGHIQQHWLNTHHTFSFGEYHDPKHMHFRSLRVINEDYVKPNSGFPFHNHMDMEILTYIISGELQHKDSLNNTSIIHRGEIQLMRAGTGITHSEFNPSKDTEVHLLQIWIIPNTKGLEPFYQQKQFYLSDNMEKLVLIASNDGENNSFTIAQDVKIYAAILEDTKLDYSIKPKRNIWIQIVEGNLEINGYSVASGDGIAITDELAISITGRGEFILFDLN